MKILVVVKNFWPEMTGIGVWASDLTDWLHARGHEISVVTSVPHYPAWSIPKEERIRFWCRDSRKPYRVLRCPIYVPSVPAGLARVLNIASFAASSAPVILAEAIRRRPDVVVTIVPTLASIPGIKLASFLTGAGKWVHVQDLEIDAAVELGMLRTRAAVRLAYGMERAMMRNIDCVSTISENMKSRLLAKCPDRKDIPVFPNWIDETAIFPLESPSPFRKELGIAANTKLLLYTGSLVAKQGLAIIPEAARHLQHRKDIVFLICGEGPMKKAIQAQSTDLPQIRFISLQPREKFNALLNAADIHLLPQMPSVSDLVMPSKLGSMLASGRPVIASVEEHGIVAQTIGPAGLVVPPGDAEALASAIIKLADDPLSRRDMGLEARRQALMHLGRDGILPRIENMLIDLAANLHRSAR